ncbi:Siderophore biosynthesis non-ribosomal peptide synthetase [Pseudomonas orientalis]|uniref:non-ribosomal peptide synthetase n=1 Tax=Pseudomonas orientalis TaxID=76758 RepID=UPI000F57DE0D|nr:non-ribosomal peptide synthetase [Pseudomonas orientalis]AZE93129.1 Siderophore biosynthesis non-ribosomal peptide synthetase [Pseudomonas orientalis]
MDIENSMSVELTAQQQALWFLAHSSTQDVRYNTGLAVRINGALNVTALQLAIHRMVSRTPLLRCTFPGAYGVPEVLFNKELSAPLMHFDARGWDEQYLAVKVQEWHYRPFDLSTDSSLRFGLFECGADEWVLVICAHHIIVDFTSLGIMLDQLECLYLDELDSDLQCWFSPGKPFSEYLALERSSLTAASADSTDAYWLEYLKHPPTTLNWDQRWRHGDNTASSHYFSIDSARYAAIRDYAVASGVSIFTVMLSAWAVAVARASDTTDVVIGIPTSMRDAQFQNTVGSLFTVLPVRLNTQASFDVLTRQARSDFFSALDHRQFNLSKALVGLQVARVPERNPLFQTTVNMLGQTGQSRWVDLIMAPSSVRAAWAGLSLSPCKLNQQEGQVDIALEFVDAQDELRCVIKADPRQFSLAGIQSFAGHLTELIDRLLIRPDLESSALVDSPQQDFNVVSGPLNQYPRDAVGAVSLVDWVDRNARLYPGRIALREQEKTLDYHALQMQSLQLADRIKKVSHGDAQRIGIALSPSIDAVVAMLAILRTGAGYVPLDPALPNERLCCIIEQSQITAVICDAQTLRQSAWPVATLDMHAVQDDADDVVPRLFDNSTANGLAYSVFTSGSTGTPKGIDVEHHSIVALLEATFQALNVEDGLVWSWTLATSFDLSVWEIWGALCSGGSLLIVPPHIRNQPDRLLALLDSAGVNVVTQTPSGLKSMLTEFSRGPVLASLRHWLICGEALPGETARHYLRDHWTLWNLYGPAETTVYASIEKVTEALARYAVVPLGRPLACATLYIVDQQRVCALGQPGEIVVGGAGVARGYVGLEALTAERFIDDPYMPGHRAYRTGDLGYWDGERVHFCGRLDDQIKVHGHRVEPGEIERCLETHEQVRQAAVFLESAAGHDRLVAVTRPVESAAPPDERNLREHLRKWLPAYMQPARFVSAQSIPINRHGKLDRQAVRQQWAAPQALDADVTPTDSAPGRGEGWRERLTTIWCEVIGKADIGADDAFFEIGGTSIALMQVHARLQEWPEGRQLLASDLFRFPTVRSLSAFLQGDTASPRESYSADRRRHTLAHRRREPQALARGGQDV